MPFYDYECRKCGAHFDAMILLSEREAEERKLTCPECGAPHPRRLLSSFVAGPSSGSLGAGSSYSGSSACDTKG